MVVWGVFGIEAPVTDEEQEQQEKLTRRERRAQAKGGTSSEQVSDRNQRLRAEAANRRKQQRSAERLTAMGEGLATGERVDAALVRSSEMASKFVRSNFAWLQWMVVLGVGVAIYIPIMRYRNNVDGEKNGHVLAAALGVEFGKVSSDEPIEQRDARLVDTRTEYASEQERSQKALVAWAGLKEQAPEVMLGAQLAAANASYDLKEYAAAISAYEKLLANKDIGKHPQIKLHALEGIGFSLEAQAKYPEALAAFKKIDSIDDRGAKQIGRLHTARVHHLLNQNDQAKTILTELDTALSKTSASSIDRPEDYLVAAVRELLRTVDPAFAIKERKQLEQEQAAEQAERLKQMIEEMQKKNGNLSFPGLPDMPAPQPAQLDEAEAPEAPGAIQDAAAPNTAPTESSPAPAQNKAPAQPVAPVQNKAPAQTTPPKSESSVKPPAAAAPPGSDNAPQSAPPDAPAEPAVPAAPATPAPAAPPSGND